MLTPTAIIAQVPAADNPTGSANSNMNWIKRTVFTSSGNTFSQSKAFYDNTGNLLQTQDKVLYRSNPTTVYTHVLATSMVHDAEGRDVLNTLPAPIDYADFNYMSSFIQATDGSNYTYKNFDRFNPSGTETDLTNSPQSIGGQSTKGTLGWYYSSNNTWEPYAPTSNYPYTRKTVYADGSNNTKKRAEPGEVFIMGSNHETSAYNTPVSGELNNYVNSKNHLFSSTNMGSMPATMQNTSMQMVTRDGNGNEVVNILDADGKVLLSGRPGTDLTFTNTVGVAAVSSINYTQQIVSPIAASFSIQVLSPGLNIAIYVINGQNNITQVYSGPSSGYTLNTPINVIGTMVIESDGNLYASYIAGTTQYNVNSLPVGTALIPTVGYFKILADNTAVSISGSYQLFNMNTEQVTSLSGGTLNRGYFKIIATSGVVNATYINGFTDVTYNYYNHLGQLVATVPPNGVKLLEGSGYNSYASIFAVPYVSLFTYDTQGRLVSSTTPDAGTSTSVYRLDGNIRFSQNAMQAATGAFSYVNYDQFARMIEVGQYQPDASGVVFNSAGMQSILENTSSTGGLTTGTKTDVTVMIYDVPDNSHGLTGYVQDQAYIGEAISTTKRYSSIVNNVPNNINLVNQTWFNYNEEGKIVWKIQYIVSLGSSGYKTIDYTYDPESRLIKKVFQKNVSAETFVHYYQYDSNNGNLLFVYTNTVDNPATEKLQAKYIYYLHGGIKRVELATNLQGIDYTYVLQGALKAINNSNSAADPGNDAIATNGFNPDAFGETLDYFPNDYHNTRTSGIVTVGSVNTSSVAADDYTGSIKAMSWYSTKPPGGGSNSPVTYAYNYDPKHQLIASTWGSPGFGTNPASFTPSSNNQEAVVVPGTGTIGTLTPGNSGYDANGNILYLQRTGSSGTTTDKFAYTYTPNTNILSTITNTGTPTGTYTYTYDALGKEVSENTGTPRYIKYDACGKVVLVAKDALFAQPIVGFVYDEYGRRIEKLSYNSSSQLSLVTYYFDDVLYTQTVSGGVYGALTPQEYNIEGCSGRLGVYFKQNNTYTYELTDHLGNVRVTISQSDVVQTAEDYYPFGYPIASLGGQYRYGIQGKYSEADPETGYNSFNLRMYNSRIARWFTGDPMLQTSSPYLALGNNPVSAIDPTGGAFEDPNGPGDKDPCSTEGWMYTDETGKTYVWSEGRLTFQDNLPTFTKRWYKDVPRALQINPDDEGDHWFAATYTYIKETSHVGFHNPVTEGEVTTYTGKRFREPGKFFTMNTNFTAVGGKIQFESTDLIIGPFTISIDKHAVISEGGIYNDVEYHKSMLPGSSLLGNSTGWSTTSPDGIVQGMNSEIRTTDNTRRGLAVAGVVVAAVVVGPEALGALRAIASTPAAWEAVPAF